MTKKDNTRVTLGDKAQQLAVDIAGDGITVTAAHLEAGILTLQKELERFQSLEKEASPKGVSSDMRKVVENEMDLLYHEMNAKLDAQHKETVDLVNGVRYMLNIFGEDANGADVEELIAETNDWLDKTIKPIEQTRLDADKQRAKEGRTENENDPSLAENATASQLLQASQTKEDAQQNLDLDKARDDDGERSV